MTFSDSIYMVQRLLGRAGYHTVREPIDIESISGNITDCEVIARNDQYNILYLEAVSDWRSTAKSVAESQRISSLTITKHGDSFIMTTIQDRITDPKTRHVVVTPKSEKYDLAAFIRGIRSNAGDDYISIDKRVQHTFDVFSRYDEAIKKFGEHLDKVISDTRHLIQDRAANNTKYDAEARKFTVVCKEILNDTIGYDDITSMLIQHIITARIFATVYDYDFYRTNSIANELERLRDILDIPDDLIDYSDIELVAESITDDDGRQQFIRRIYETFYKKYDPKRAQRDGIVYTPTEIVDFILNSVQYVLESEFETSFSDRQVTVLDPFTGTGTFIARLMGSGLLGSNLEPKYRNDIFANEMLLLAFYIATVNMESTHAGIAGSGEYAPFEGMNYTDTFMMDPRYLEGGHHRQEETKIDEKFTDIRKRRQKQRKTNLHVIIGNPPYSAGQTSYNDQNQNISYPEIDRRIGDTYMSKLKTINPKLGAKNSMYDSYIRSIRWASDRIGESGIIGFVTNASFIRSEAAAGVRACLQEEFTDVWVFDLRGDGRRTGDGRNIFEYRGQGSGGTRTPVAIIILVKNSKKQKHVIRYSTLQDRYYSGQDKRDRVKHLSSIRGIKEWQVILPDRYHDWLNQRSDEFSKHLPMGSKDAKAGKENAMFRMYSRGVGTGRDSWAYDSSLKQLTKNMKRHVDYCNSQDPLNPIFDSKKAKWDSHLSKKLFKKKVPFSKKKIRASLYRPFFKQFLYFDDTYNQERPKFFPENDSKNLVICYGFRADMGMFGVLIVDKTPDLGLMVPAPIQCFPLKTKKLTGGREAQSVHNSALQDTGRVLGLHNGHDTGSGSGPSRASIPISGADEMMQDNITDYALAEYRRNYKNDTISKLDIFYYVYGILHHPGYRKKYANNLTRELPHIPMAPDFWSFSGTGRKLADLHLSWETCPRYDLGPPKAEFGKYEKMDYARTKKNSKMVQDKTTLRINGTVAFDNIPKTNYKVNGRTPLEWAIDRYKVHKDKESGITNDATAGVDIIPLVERLVYVGTESDRLVSSLPDEFEPEDWEPKKTGMDEFVEGSGSAQTKFA